MPERHLVEADGILDLLQFGPDFGLGLRPVYGSGYGEEHTGQNGDDRDHHQHLHEGEALPAAANF
ncbi:hypothetical protein SDC9_161304 [bioreactor metagenome]|uniref:Uncharacterized protein n=1 Tax=bioreactor metagenome TaxID=1076179 RepID=A0A645FHU8_9ZZZZ